MILNYHKGILHWNYCVSKRKIDIQLEKRIVDEWLKYTESLYTQWGLPHQSFRLTTQWWVSTFWISYICDLFIFLLNKECNRLYIILIFSTIITLYSLQPMYEKGKINALVLNLQNWVFPIIARIKLLWIRKNRVFSGWSLCVLVIALIQKQIAGWKPNSVSWI